VLGTPGWIAPEQLAGGPASPAGDVFAWGCLIAFAASGRPPFGAGPPEVVAQRVVWQRPDLAGVPESLRQLVVAATDRDPAKRPPARRLLLTLLGDRAAADPQAAATQVVQRTWVAPIPGWGPPARERPATGGPAGRPWYRRRRSVLLVVLVVLLLSALHRADDGRLSGGSSSRATTRSTATGVPATSAPARGPGGGAAGRRGVVRDGKLEFAVSSVSCGHDTVGQGPLRFGSNGQFCLVRLQVRNIGHQSWTLPINQYLFDTTGDRHSIDLRAGVAVSSQRLLQQLEPGQRVSGTLVFNLPTGAHPERLELHDSLLSGGTELRVLDP
jgi:hypothetical protein